MKDGDQLPLFQNYPQRRKPKREPADVYEAVTSLRLILGPGTQIYRRVKMHSVNGALMTTQQMTALHRKLCDDYAS